MSKFSKLREMDLQRYLEVKDASEHWKDYSTKEKLTYLQKTFDHLNEYNSLKYGYDPREIKFSFSSGRDPSESSAFYMPKIQSISVPFIHTFSGMISAKGFDKTMRHEFRHFIQDRILGKDGQGKKYDPFIVQPSYYHDASQNEIDADRSAIKGAIKSDFMGLVKSDTKVHAFKELVQDVKFLAQNHISHNKAQIAYSTKGKFFASKKDKEIQREQENGEQPQSTIFPIGPLYYSYGQLCRLIDKTPEKFTSIDSFYREGGIAKLKEYRESNLPLHDVTSFLGLAHNGFRDCWYAAKNENGELYEMHEFDRYDKDGNLIDEEDKNAEYDLYTPQEVSGYKLTQTENNEENIENEEINAVENEIFLKDTDEGAPPPVG